MQPNTTCSLLLLGLIVFMKKRVIAEEDDKDSFTPSIDNNIFTSTEETITSNANSNTAYSDFNLLTTTTPASATFTPTVSNSENIIETNSSCAELYNKCRAAEKVHQETDLGQIADKKITLYISAFYEGPGGAWDGSGCVPAIEMAFDDINARTDILPQYELRPIWNDTKVRDCIILGFCILNFSVDKKTIKR